MNEIPIRRLQGESINQYLWRIGTAKDQGLITHTWGELAEIFNEELDEDFGESAYRKRYHTAKDFYNEVFVPSLQQHTLVTQLQEQQEEILKATQRLRDQRRERNKELRYEARIEHLHRVICEEAAKLACFEDTFGPSVLLGEEGSEAILCLNDWHYGMITDNLWNTYNTEICRDRVNELAFKTAKYLRRHKVHALHIALLGDACHGGIHASARVESEELVCSQLMNVSELLATCIEYLSTCVDKTIVYSTYGNHMRTIQNKHDSIHGDNMEKIIPWWLKERFRKKASVVIEDSDKYNEFIVMPICGRNVVAAHGDLEQIRSMGVTFQALFTKLYGMNVDYVVVGDRHHYEQMERLGVDSMVVPALCGTDGYAHGKRLYSDPGQVLMMFSEDEGRECVYTIKFTR